MALDVQKVREGGAIAIELPGVKIIPPVTKLEDEGLLTYGVDKLGELFVFWGIKS